MNESFDKLDNEFNTPTTNEPEKELEVFEKKKTELVEKSTQVKTLEDKTYLQDEIKSLIDNSKRVLDTVQKDIKIGTAPRTIEVYAKLMSATIDGIRELRELNQTIANMQMFRDPLEKQKATVNVSLTGKELIQLMKEAKEKSQMDAVDTTFSVEEQPDEPTK